jgi:hypothetical protein
MPMLRLDAARNRGPAYTHAEHGKPLWQMEWSPRAPRGVLAAPQISVSGVCSSEYPVSDRFTLGMANYQGKNWNDDLHDLYSFSEQPSEANETGFWRSVQLQCKAISKAARRECGGIDEDPTIAHLIWSTRAVVTRTPLGSTTWRTPLHRLK